MRTRSGLVAGGGGSEKAKSGMASNRSSAQTRSQRPRSDAHASRASKRLRTGSEPILENTPNPRLTSSGGASSSSPIDGLPDDIIISIFAALSAKASAAKDLINAMITCRRFFAAGMHPQVLACASADAMAVRARKWSNGAHAYLQRAADAGNPEACYTLGMIRFYCLDNRRSGGFLMAKAAIQSHAAALHSLAVIHFNGSAGGRKDKDLKAGVALCGRAAALGHVDAMRELGHCLQDGYGVARNVVEGRRLLLEANALEAAAVVAAAKVMGPEAVRSGAGLSSNWLMLAASTSFSHWTRGEVYGGGSSGVGGAVGSNLPISGSSSSSSSSNSCHEAAVSEELASSSPLSGEGSDAGDDEIIDDAQAAVAVDDDGSAPSSSLMDEMSPFDRHPVYKLLQGEVGSSLLSDFGCNVPPTQPYAANRFLVDWFLDQQPAEGLRLCSHSNCGRPEMRRHEFRRCSACGCVNYCSRACQALDWKIRHKYKCMPVAEWIDQDIEGEDDVEMDGEAI